MAPQSFPSFLYCSVWDVRGEFYGHWGTSLWYLPGPGGRPNTLVLQSAGVNSTFSNDPSRSLLSHPENAVIQILEGRSGCYPDRPYPTQPWTGGQMFYSSPPIATVPADSCLRPDSRPAHDAPLSLLWPLRFEMRIVSHSFPPSHTRIFCQKEIDTTQHPRVQPCRH